MTVIAYKDGIVAADGQSSRAGIKYRVQKLFEHGNEIIAACGDYSRAIQMRDWYVKGRVDPLPASSDNTFARLLVFRGKYFLEFENMSTPVKRTDKLVAFGSGSDIALGAMEMGASAIQAVEIAIKHLDSCGMGVSYKAVRK